MTSKHTPAISPAALAGINQARAEGKLTGIVAGATTAIRSALGIKPEDTKTPTPSGAQTDALILDFLYGHMAGSLHPTGAPTSAWIAAAKAIKELKGTGAKVPANEKRTDAQETAYAAARQAKARLMSKLGLKTTDPRGGPRKGESESNAEPANDAPVPATPGFKTVGEFLAYLTTQAAAMTGAAEKAGRLASPQAKHAISTFRAAVAKLTADAR